jgi:hypothetical protein
MAFTPITPVLIIRNISKSDVNILGVKIRPGQQKDIYQELEYDENGSLATTVLKELETPNGKIYRLWKVLDVIRIIECVNPTHFGSGLVPESITASNDFFEGAVLGYEGGEFKWLSGGGGGGVSAVTASSPLSSSGGATPDISLGTVGVANGGTGTTTQFAQGSVVFAGPSGVYAQDSANLIWDDTNDRLGIGIAAPTASLHVAGTVLAKNTANSTTAFQVQNAAGAVILDVDTINSRVGIGAVPAAHPFEIRNNFAVGGGGRIHTYAGSAPTNGQVLIGDTANGHFDKATLTAGTNIGITNAAGSITVGLSGTVAVGNGGTGITAPGSTGNVLTSNGTGWVSSAPTGGPPSGAAGGDLTGSTYPNPIISSFGGKIHWVVQGGKYATLQAAVDAASAEDVIMVGPKTSGDWGNVVLNVVNKPLIIAATAGAGANKIVKIGSGTYDLGTTGPALNVGVNETYLYGLYIQGSFTGSAVTLTGGANYPGRLRLYGCYILNSSATGAAAVTNSNQGANSSLYLDACVVSLANSTTGSAVVQTAGYTVIRNRCDVSGSSAALATGNAINVSAGTMEIYDSYISIPVRAGAVVGYPTVNVTGSTTFVSAGYSTILNDSDAAGACCAFIGTSGARFGAGDATLAAGSTLPTLAVAVSGVAGGSFLYANVSFSFVTTVSTVTPTATLQSGGLFSYGLSVGSLLGTAFAVNASGNITKINNVTTSFPSAQGSANQVLTNNGSGTLTWSNGNLRTLGSVSATPTAANLRTNATYTVNVAAVALPAMAAGDDGLTISLVNISGAGSTVTPSTGVARTMTTGGGQTWVWRNAATTWYCISNV